MGNVTVVASSVNAEQVLAERRTQFCSQLTSRELNGCAQLTSRECVNCAKENIDKCVVIELVLLIATYL